MEHRFCPYCMSPVEEGKPCGACGLTEGSYTPSPHHLPPGTVLRDRYLVGRVLGEGGFGITYIGCDLQLELKVAIKEYFPTDKASRVSQASLDVSSYAGAAGVNYDKGLKRFLQEARTIARMDKQPVIVNVRDFFEVNHTAYIVMEYVEGTTFKDLVAQRGGRIPAGELLYLIEPLFFALKEMHGNGLIHRDISPENLMLEKGEVRLLDFGCAREAMGGDNTLTVALKHGYAPVEQYQSKGQGPWTDVYALSATIYYCLTGRKPPQAVDRLGEDGLVPPRKLGVDLTQKQEKALLHGMAVPPTRRFQSMEEFHTALYEGFVPDTAGADPAARGPEAQGAANFVTTTTTTTGAAAETTGEAAPAPRPKPGFDFADWLRKNKLLAVGAAAALALVILLAAVLPRAAQPAQPAEDPPASNASAPTQLPEQGGDGTGYEESLRQVMETVTWLRQDDVELDQEEIQTRLDAMPLDALFANAVHVTTIETLDRALEDGDRPIVIDGDITYSADRTENMNIGVPVLVSEGVTVSVPWENCGEYENAAESEGCWTVDGSILINRGTVRGRINMGDWDGDGVEDDGLLINFGTLHSDLGAGYDENHDSVVVNLGVMSIPRTQFRRTSFYNLGTLLHGVIAPEGETPLIVTPQGGDYFIDLIGCFFYNGGEIVLEGRDRDCRSRIDAAGGTRFANHGTVRLGAWGQLNNSAAVLNYGEIAAVEQTAEINNLGWLWNTGADCAMDTSRCYNTGLVQAGPETSVDLSGVRGEDGGAALPFGWYEGMEEQADIRHVSSAEELYGALEDRECTWVVLSDGAALTLTEDLVLTKSLAVPFSASLTMEGAGLTVADCFLAADGPIDLGDGVFTVRDEAVASVRALRGCGGLTIRSGGYLLLRDGLTPNEGAEIRLSNANYLTSIGSLELRGARVTIEEGGGVLRSTGGVNLYGCAVDIGAYGEFLVDGGGYFDPDTEINSGGGMTISGWNPWELAGRLHNSGRLEVGEGGAVSGSLVNEGSLTVWSGGEGRLKVSGTLENHGTVEFPGGGQFQPWAAGSITGVPQEFIAD